MRTSSPSKHRRATKPTPTGSRRSSPATPTPNAAHRAHVPVAITRDATVEVRCALRRSAPVSRRLQKVVEQLAAALKIDVDVERARGESTRTETVWYVNGEEAAAESFLAVVRMIAAAHRSQDAGSAPAPRIRAEIVSSGAFLHWPM